MRWFRFLLPALVLFVSAIPKFAVADGGRVQRSEIVDGKRITVFTSPVPLRVGDIDISVLVQDDETGQVIRNVPLRVELRWVSDGATTMSQIGKRLSHEHSTNRLMQSAIIKLPYSGQWRSTIHFDLSQQPAANNSLEFQMTVHEQPAMSPTVILFVALPFLLVSVYILRESISKRPPYHQVISHEPTVR
ncbi:MAG: hypothetical protein KatS3mg105_5074 [Gemmatales bacterium]|nr:MAG: hypothetical protein KatS3mg105_5074 [Gemmatales bacterium]